MAYGYQKLEGKVAAIIIKSVNTGEADPAMILDRKVKKLKNSEYLIKIQK